MSLSSQRLTKDTALDHFLTMGFKESRINRALKLYESNYPIYNICVVKELIYRLNIKDKIKKFKKHNNTTTYYSRVNVKQALESLTFHAYYIDLAIQTYEV